MACSAQPNWTASDCLLAPSCSRSQCQIFCHHFISLAPFVKASLVFDSFSLSPPKFGSEIIYSDDEWLFSRDVFFLLLLLLFWFVLSIGFHHTITALLLCELWLMPRLDCSFCCWRSLWLCVAPQRWMNLSVCLLRKKRKEIKKSCFARQLFLFRGQWTVTELKLG